VVAGARLEIESGIRNVTNTMKTMPGSMAEQKSTTRRSKGAISSLANL
jgi:hypothetical protein